MADNIDPISLAVGSGITLGAITIYRYFTGSNKNQFTMAPGSIAVIDNTGVCLPNTNRGHSFFSSFNQAINRAHENGTLNKIGVTSALVIGSIFALRYFNSSDAVDELGNTLLHQAVIESDREKVIWLLNRDKSLQGYFNSVVHSKAKPNQKNKDGDTPLHLAVKSLNAEIAAELLRAGADPYIKNINGDNPFNLAHQSNDEAIRSLFASRTINVPTFTR